jgi:hypothetical protein
MSHAVAAVVVAVEEAVVVGFMICAAHDAPAMENVLAVAAGHTRHVPIDDVAALVAGHTSGCT